MSHIYILPLLTAEMFLLCLGGYHFLPNRGGGMKKLGGSQNFFVINRGGHKKKSREFWMATNFNENFVK